MISSGIGLFSQPTGGNMPQSIQQAAATEWDISTAMYNQSFSDLLAPEADPVGLAFKPDGTRMYLIAGQGRSINSYILSTPWDVTDAQLEYIMDMSSYEYNPRSIYFTPDGLKLFVAGQSGDDVNEFHLTTAWDLSSTSFVRNQSFMTSLVYGFGISFSTDGTRCYVVAQYSRYIMSYSLSTPWDTGTANYDSSFLTSPQEYGPRSLYFKSDGTKMYLMGSSRKVTEYNLSVAWDINSASVVNDYIVSTQTNNPFYMQLNASGSKMYILGYSEKAIFEYDLSTPWDITSATHVNTVPYSAQESWAYCFFINSSETKLYIVGSSRNIHEYDLTTAGDLSSLSHVQSFYMSPGIDNLAYGVTFRDDGQMFYIVDGVFGRIREFALSNAWDLSGVSYHKSSAPLRGNAYNLQSNHFSTDGTKMYLAEFYGRCIVEYDLSIPWDLASAQFSTILDLEPTHLLYYILDLDFSVDGTKMYVVDYGSNRVHVFSLSMPWSIDSAVYDTYMGTSNSGSPRAIAFKGDGSRMYIIDGSQDTVDKYDLSTAWNVTTNTLAHNSEKLLSAETGQSGIFFKNDGLRMYTVGFNGDSVGEYQLSSAWDLSSAQFIQSFHVGSQEGYPTSVFFNPVGTKMYVAGRYGDEVNEYNLGTAWDISTCVFQHYFTVNTEESNTSGLFFNPDGTKMYITGYSGDDVNEYNLSTPWDVSSASYIQNFSIATEETTPRGLFFRPDGLRMLIVGSSGDGVNEYVLSTPWDISSASYSQNLSVRPHQYHPMGVWINPAATKMYISGFWSNAIHEFNLG
ncbi:MAG: beta-propeller fold lactonase family protein [Cyclobacteriaceae bacterium]